MKKYYDNAKDNAAFERCVNVMADLILKYGPGILEKHRKEGADKQTKGSQYRSDSLKAA
ncbi:MAG: hypothetical protein LUG27_04055 [Clostridiales bacterium]|nr:hypothetical protein [Clostridiales bacterium]